MADTTFVDQSTVIVAAWLNDVNDTVYSALGAAGVAPTTAAQVRTNIGLGTMATQAASAVAITGGTIAGTSIPVSSSGTGITSTTPYGVIFGGTTPTGPLQASLGVGTSGQVLTSAGAGALPTWSTVAGAGATGYSQDFRLTLTTAVPITTADVTGATTIYCTPYKGKFIDLYDGAAWNKRSSAEFSLALGTLTSGLPYDVFCYDNATVPTLEFTAWTNSTTRATALVTQDGVLCKTGALTRRYLGTFYTTATTTTEDSVSKRYLFNYYNRAPRLLERKEGTASWTYSTATWRQANNAAANQVNMFIGVVDDVVTFNALQSVTANNTQAQASAVGFNSITVPSGEYGTTASSSSTSISLFSMASNFIGYPALGLNYAAWLEWAQSGGTTTWYGVNASATLQTQSGINGRVNA